MIWKKTHFIELNFPLDIESEFYSVEHNIQSGNIKVFEAYKKATYLNYSVQQVASWSETEGMKFLQMEKYRRRGNLSGVELTITTLGDVGQI